MMGIAEQARGLRQIFGTGAHMVKPVKVISVTGGKGGVGKTSLSVNLAIALADMGRRVMLLDADLGLANVDVMLGLRVERNLAHVLRGECALADIVVSGPGGIRIVPASSGRQDMAQLSKTEHAGLIRAFSELTEDIDILIVDTAAGIADNVISFTLASQDIIAVVCDEPTSITDVYALMKILSTEHDVFRFRVVANMVRSPQEGKRLFAKLTAVTDKFLDVTVDYIGAIPFDENVRLAVRKQSALVHLHPRSPASVAIQQIARKVDSWPLPVSSRGHIEFFTERLVAGVMGEV